MRISISEKEKFVLRAAAIFLRDQSVLLHRADHENIWALPGGGCEFGESSQQALAREMNEELGAFIEVKSLAFFVENFFQWDNQKAHEIGLYHICAFTGDSERFYKMNEFDGVEEKMEGFSKFKLHFKWFRMADLQNENVKPDFLKTRLSGMNGFSEHIVNYG